MIKINNLLPILLFFTAGLLCGTPEASAEPAPEEENNILYLSAEKAVDMAFTASHEIKKARLSTERQHSRYKEIKSSIYPQVTGSYSWNRYIETPVINMNLGMGPMEIPLNQDWETRFGITLSQVIFAFGKITNAMELAEKTMDMQRYSSELTKNQVAYGTKQIYYSILFAEKSLEIARQSHENVQQNREALKERFSGGRASRANNIKMAADLAGRVPRIIDLEERIQGLKIKFRDMLGLRDGKNRQIKLADTLEDDFTQYSYKDLKEKMLRNSPQLKMARTSTELRSINSSRQRSEYFPTISGFVNYSYSGQSEDPFLEEEDLNREVIAGIKLNYTFWDSGGRRNALKGAKIEEEISETEYRKLFSDMTVELESAVKRYNKLIKLYESKKEAESLARESYEIILSNFSSGQVSQTMLNDTEMQLTGARLDTLSTLYQIALTRERIANLTARNIQ